MIPAVQILHSIALLLICISATFGSQPSDKYCPPLVRMAAAACLVAAQVCAAYGRPYP